MRFATLAVLATSSLAVAAVARAQSRSTLTDSVIRRLDSVFVDLDRSSSPGCATAVYRDGAVAYARGYGMANLEHAIAISPRTIFDLGSTSKQFAAASIILLALDGRIAIDDDVRKYIPELPQYQRPITIRHLLNHTSGLRDYLTLFWLKGINEDGVTTDRDALDVIVRQKALNFEPGSEWLYSNSGFFLLSIIVKRVSEQTLAEFARNRIFEPLGMSHTHFHDDHTLVVPERATGYAPRPGGYAISMSGFEQTGDGAVMTTVEDLLQWDSNFYTPRVGGDAMLRELHTHGKLSDGKQLDYTLGLFVDEYRGLRRVRHGGAWAGYRADLLRFPSERTSVAVLCNLSTARPSSRADRIAEIVLAGRLAPGTTTARRRHDDGYHSAFIPAAPCHGGHAANRAEARRLRGHLLRA